MRRAALRTFATVLTTASALALTAGCGLNSATKPDSSSAPRGAGVLKVGASLPLTGVDAEFGKAAQQGYETWAAVVNEHGGLLGSKVEMIIRDDASDQNTAVADYNSLLSSDHVDLLLGTFSSFLVGPTSAIAEKQHKLFVTPTGGAPDLYQRGFKMMFLTQQATATGIGDAFAHYILSLPPSQRPTTAAYPTLDDPFQIPTMDNIRKQLEAVGIKTVYQTVYATDTQNFDQIANAIKASGAQLVAQGAGFEDAVGLTRALVKASASPKYLYQTAGPDTGSAYGQAVGVANTNGTFFSTTWSPMATTPGNPEFLAAYRKLFGSDVPHEDAADAYAAGQVLQAAVTAVGEQGIADQQKLADWLRSHTVTPIIAELAWNSDGSPKGEELLGQWQNDVIQIVRPASAATTPTVISTWRSTR
jgi:branched-chain amino acid transport system substrate-binding protein